MQLTPFCLTLSCLRISPDRSQFFRYDSFSLSCDNQLNSTGWKVTRETPDIGVRPCSSSWGFASSGSTCIIRNTYPTDSGVYWCQSGDRTSNGVNITITDRTVILESPALPVSEGAAVILHCKAEPSSSDNRFHFYKDGRRISSKSTSEMTIHRASKSDEGLYKCSTTGGEESASSWLAVEGENGSEWMEVEGAVTSSNPMRAPSANSSSKSIFRVMCHLVVGTPYLLSTIILGLIYRDMKRAARMVAERRGSCDVIMEIAV